MLTKSRLDQYIKDNELVPIGTELVTIQLGECVVKKHDVGSVRPLYIANKNGDGGWYTEGILSYTRDAHTSLIDPTPSTVESPFSKEELEFIKHDLDYDSNSTPIRKLINDKLNHLLTNANEFPCLMEVASSEHATEWFERMVICQYNGRYIALDGSFDINKDHLRAWQHARPIEQKPKELKDLKEGGSIWDIETLQKRTFIKTLNGLVFYNTGTTDGVVSVKDFNDCFQIFPPTEQQFTAAEEAAINEVKARFDGLKKGGQGNG